MKSAIGNQTLPAVLGSISPSLDAKLGSLAQPYIALPVDKIALSVLIPSVLITVGSVLGGMVPSKPPCSPIMNAVEQQWKVSFKSDAWAMLKSPEFWMIATPLTMGLAIFNVWTSLLFLYLAPYGFPVEVAGLLIGLKTGVGAFVALAIEPIVDKKGWHLFVLSVGYSIEGLCYIIFIWVPPSESREFAFCVAILMAIVAMSPLAIALEALAEIL